ncbi:hypothetical protein ACFLZP_01675 [Patescibacteria group bacterium]
MTKVQLSLTDQEAALLTSYGAYFGYSLPKVIRFILAKTAEQVLDTGVIPTYKLSEKNEKKGLEALREHRQGKTIKIKDPDHFFDSL